MREDFKVTIVKTSKSETELSARERILLKDTSSAIALDSVVTDTESITISPVGFAILEVHNDKAKGDKDYTQYLILDSNGDKYSTGSTSFWNAFSDIWDEMDFNTTGEAFDIKIYRKPSKNYTGKSFITCSII